jgi:hypothetical protein
MPLLIIVLMILAAIIIPARLLQRKPQRRTKVQAKSNQGSTWAGPLAFLTEIDQIDALESFLDGDDMGRRRKPAPKKKPTRRPVNRR